MPDLNGKKIVIIGAGPTSIGQAGECDEGAIEACQALNTLGCHLMVVNSNPDAVVNDGPWRHHTHIEPLTEESLKAILKTEQPDALVPLFGGREGLHLVAKLMTDMDARHPNPAIWGPAILTLDMIHNRETLQSALAPINLKTPPIFSVQGVDGAIEKARELGFPVVLRCDDAHQLPDGTLIYNQDELNDTAASLSGEAIVHLTVEASLVDWQQIEIEILRDKSGQSYAAGSVEYMDTAAIHPGDAVGICPPQTLNPAMQSQFFDHAAAIVEHLNIIGGATIRFAHHPSKDRPLVLAVHPRYTGTSALVSRVSGLPIAKLSTLLAAGFTWDELPAGTPLPQSVHGDTGMVAVKHPVWNFEQLEGVADRLGPKMQAVGQSIGFGAGFSEALQKAMGANSIQGRGLASAADSFADHSLDELLAIISTPASQRLGVIFEALRRQAPVDEVAQKTHMADWFIDQLKALADITLQMESQKIDQLPTDLLPKAKALGFSHQDLADLLNISSVQLEQQLAKLGTQRNWTSLPGDNHHQFSTFGQIKSLPCPSAKNKIVILGSGSHEIGNGSEQDYGIYHTALALKKSGYQPIIVNNNAVSTTTGHSSPALCYCEPLSAEAVAAILQREQAAGVITQFAGDRAYELSALVEDAGIPIMGTPRATMALVKDRSNFREQMKSLGIPQPTAMLADSAQTVRQAVEQIGYPLSIHSAGSSIQSDPVLISDTATLERYLDTAHIDFDNTVWVEQFLEFAIETQAEVLCDGKYVHTVAVLEHIELAGVHAGDSACVLPPYSIAPRHMETLKAYCGKVAIALGIRGLVNIRFAIYRDTVYLLEAICGASRNLGLVTRTAGLPLVALTTKVMLGGSLADLVIDTPVRQVVGVRAPVFPFNVFSDVDPLLGPQMRATGQVLAIADEFGMAYFKAIASTATPLPTQGTVLITVTDEDKPSILEPARIFHELGFKIMATKGTCQTLGENGIQSTLVRKLGYGRPNLVDEIKNGNVQMVINTPTGSLSQIDDSVIRKAAIAYGVANITTPASALAAARGIAAHRQTKGSA